MKFFKQAVVAFALLGSVGSTWAWWGTWDYQGEVVSDKGTGLITTQKAGNTWDDWVWRGKKDGTVQACSSNSKGCTFSWGKTKSTAYAHTVGWAVEGGFSFPVKSLGVSVGAEYQRQKTWTQTQTETFDMRTDMKPGQWAQPVIVAVRRWRKGYFYGGFFADQISRSNKWGYTYEWAWRNYGAWQGSEQEWGYKMIQVVDNRNSL